ncbi:MAG: CSLREA domain-containing protein, partial [Chloroflexi bacterium]|nr:CSLREA domain-containing protein [Chloroflexota bacterium]
MRFIRLLLLVAFLFSFGLYFSTSYHTTHAATTINVTTTADAVTTNGQCSLREAINLINGVSAADCGTLGTAPYTINVPAGTYTITIASTNEDANLNGDFDIITPVTINGAGIDQTIIQAHTLPESAGGRVFDIINDTTNVTFNGLTIRHGNEIAHGGGIRTEGPLNLDDVKLSDNFTTERGGAIYVDGAPVDIRDSEFVGNVGESDGGAIYFRSSDAIVRRSTFTNNDSAARYGGAIYNTSSSTLEILTSFFTLNNTNARGGAIYNAATLTLDRSTIYNNSAADGGGIYNTLNADIINSTISENGVTSRGGAIYNSRNLDTIFTTIANNFDSNNDEGGVYNTGSSAKYFSSHTIHYNFGDNCSGSGDFIDGRYNISGDNTCNWGDTNFTGVGDNVDPLINAIANNGGPTLTHSLKSGSPAIDRKGATCAPELNGIDQRGQPRLISGGGDDICDIGSYESDLIVPTATGPTLTFTPTDTSTPTPTPSNTRTPSPTRTPTVVPSPTPSNHIINVETTIDERTTNGLCSLREAVDVVNELIVPDCEAASTPYIINLTVQGSYTLTLGAANQTDEELNAEDDLDVIRDDQDVLFQGLGQALTIMQSAANPANSDHRIIESHDSSIIMRFSKLTIRNGFTPDDGGGIYSYG